MSDKKEKGLTKRGLWASVIILLIGMTVGFALLATVYTGATWKKVVVFFLYLIVVSLLIRSVRKLSDALDEEEAKAP